MAFEPIETQEAFDAAIKERLARERDKVAAETSAKFADYDELAEKAKAYDEAQEALKSEAQKAQERIAELEGSLKERDAADKRREARHKVAKETGVPEDLIRGDDEDAMKAHAAAIAEYAKARKPTAPKDLDVGSFSGGGAGSDDKRAFIRRLLGRED